MITSGTRLGDRYILVDMVARGALGEVWRADDTMLDRVVAVKLLSSGEPNLIDRLRRPAQALAALNDPTIVEMYDLGQADGIVYLVTQFVPGESLHALLHRVGPLAPPNAMNLIAQAARGLQVAHSKGILHLDVKASNLLVRRDGRLVLTDFAIAGIISGTTKHDWVTGAVPYVPPEPVVDRPVTPYTDIFALGVVAYVPSPRLCVGLAGRGEG